MPRLILIALITATLNGCAPVLIGAAGAVVVDEVLEEERGGDGLF